MLLSERLFSYRFVSCREQGKDRAESEMREGPGGGGQTLVMPQARQEESRQEKTVAEGSELHPQQLLLPPPGRLPQACAGREGAQERLGNLSAL